MNRKLKPLMFVDPPEGGDPSGGGGGNGGEPPEGAPKETPKTFTQEDLTRVATREKAEGKQAAQRELAEQLGVSIDEAKAIIKAAKDAEDAKKSDADKDREAAAREKQEAEAQKAEAAKEVHQARLERAFARQGVDLGEADDKTKRLLRMVTVEPGASFDDVLKDVEQIKSDFPGLFEGQGEEDKSKQKRTAPGGDPKGTPPKPKAGEDKYSAGAERAKNHGRGRLVR